MKKILVPTDFSENSRSAFLYAVELAKQLNASVTIMHCYHPTANHINDHYFINDEELENLSAQRLDLFVEKSFNKSTDADTVEQKLEVGFAADKLVEISKSGAYDMIVMGATGSTGVLDRIFGKVSLHVAQYSKCPVLLIPAGVEYSEVRDIMYASEYELGDGDILLQLGEITDNFSAKIHLVHVYNENEKTPEGIGHFLLEKMFQKKAPGLNFYMDSVSSDTVAHGLEEYARKNNMDWMVLVKPQRNLWQRLLHKSKTNEIIMNPEIPLMVMH